MMKKYWTRQLIRIIILKIVEITKWWNNWRNNIEKQIHDMLKSKYDELCIKCLSYQINNKKKKIKLKKIEYNNY